VFDKKITFKYRQKEENLEKPKRDRFFWKFFENSIEYANKKCREFEKERLRIEAKRSKTGAETQRIR